MRPSLLFLYWRSFPFLASFVRRGFEVMHEAWLASHPKRRTGERRSRLLRGHGHGERLFLERVWWPLYGSFDHLHPEYEVAGWRGQPDFVDFAWIRGNAGFAFEIKGYGPRVQQADRARFRRERNRETFLQTLGYRVVSIPYDALGENPEITRFLIRSLMAPYMAADGESRCTPPEREVLRCAMHDISPNFARNGRYAANLQYNQSFRPFSRKSDADLHYIGRRAVPVGDEAV